jgi:hypothetical protein
MATDRTHCPWRRSKARAGALPSPKLCARLATFIAVFTVTTISSAQQPPRFENIASKAGLTKTIPNGGEKTKTWLVETTGSGAAFLDYDNDGLLDALLVSGPGGPSRLYRNAGDGKFTDVTQSVLPGRDGWGQGVCAGDYDNDGFTDLLITYWGQNSLLHNLGGKRFEDVTQRAALTQNRTRYNTGCAFLDYDRDGDLDLFVANYLQFDFATTPRPGDNPYCFYRNVPVACGPRGLPFDTQLLYRNNGDGTFTDVSGPAGITRARQHYALGVLTGDFDNDGFPDIYVACDRTPSILFMNQRDGTFSEEALLRGAALDENGNALSGMGATAADFNGDGVLDVFRTNFSDERSTLYRNRGKGDFDEATTPAGIGHNTRFVGWGAGFFDFDNDSWPDLLLVNGHVFPEVDRITTDIRYHERPILYHNRGDGSFSDISEKAGPGILEPHASRGAAFGDFDNDGLVEVLVNNQNEAPSLLKQTSRPPGHWITLQLEGVKSSRSAIGAKVRVVTGKRSQIGEVRSGGSYLSQSDLRLHFGLGTAGKVDQVVIDWPSGIQQTVTGLSAGKIHTIRELVTP